MLCGRAGMRVVSLARYGARPCHRSSTSHTTKGTQRKQEGTVSIGNYANIDTARVRRTGFPEVVFGEGKTAPQIAEIFTALVKSTSDAATLATRVSSDTWEKIQPLLDEAGVVGAQYHPQGRMIVYKRENIQLERSELRACVVAAGTSDLPVAEEACLTLDASGYPATRVYDVGVAGIHRLFAKLDDIRAADVVIVVAGMDGALPSAVAGLVDAPVIAVPTSVGYGAAFQGVAALLTMLNSCAPGLTVVNIDNGFGAAASCVKILRRVSTGTQRVGNDGRL